MTETVNSFLDNSDENQEFELSEEEITPEVLTRNVGLILQLSDTLLATLGLSKNINIYNFEITLNQLRNLYRGLFFKMSEGSFDFDPDINRLKGLMIHDFRKPLSNLNNYFELREFYKEDQDKHVELFNLSKTLFIRALRYMRGAARVINSINATNLKGEKVLLHLHSIIDILSLESKNNQMDVYESQEFSLIIEFAFNFEEEFTVEQFFTISTLILNVSATNATKVRIEIRHEEEATCILVYDNAVYETPYSNDYTWPRFIFNEYNECYLDGFARPDAPLLVDTKGLRMVYYLAGQRHAKHNIGTDKVLLHCVDGNINEAIMKHIKLTYPNSKPVETQEANKAPDEF